ncbi:protocadherin-23 [Lates japonicus]|uniref:Protocadherin-23 n=1 Tax=Lates japonicus TaxID=270547 RepID=A0AAD3R244_LATJO|nr:protocadherin-23 [Lates japonicus]
MHHESAVVWYSLLPGPGYELFSINPARSHHHHLPAWTRQQQHYTLRSKLAWQLQRPLSGTATVQCSVLGDNDNPPEFMQSSFQSACQKTCPGVIHAQASGEDYRAASPSTVTQVLSAPTPSSSTQLQLVLLDQSDNIPPFTRKSYHASISEACLDPAARNFLWAVSRVIRYRALDRDQGSVHLRAMATDGGCTQDPDSMASVTAHTGEIRVQKDVFGLGGPQIQLVVLADGLQTALTAGSPITCWASRQQRHCLNTAVTEQLCGRAVQAADGGLHSTFSATIRVQVVDVNDNSPAIPQNDLPAVTRVTMVTASDVDLSSTIFLQLFRQ